MWFASVRKGATHAFVSAELCRNEVRRDPGLVVLTSNSGRIAGWTLTKPNLLPASDQSTLGRLKYFMNPFDHRYEDMDRKNWVGTALRDVSAGLIVAMMAIPMAMGFAIASGLRPEHGILAGAIAGLFGALFGGSKYNVYGPVAALIPVIAGIMAKYATPADPFAGHSFLVLICMGSGLLLLPIALLGWGKVGNLVPHSVVVGFSAGIAVTIALTQFGEVLGLKTAVTGSFFQKLTTIVAHIHETNGTAIFLGLAIFVITKILLGISIYIPAPLIALGFGTLLSSTVFSDSGIALVSTKYGQIPTNFFMITPPGMPSTEMSVILDLVFYSVAFAFVCSFESVLAARMADRLADNKRTPYDPNKEFWGQGLIQIFVPLLNGMPLSGALARTATNIKVGAVTPLAGIMKCFLKLLLAWFLADYLEQVPMACIGGILLWVALNMVKVNEMKEIWGQNKYHAALMIYTAIVVVFAGFMAGVLSAMIIYAAFYKRFEPNGNPATAGH
jgi:SulP family sulfate permease